MTRLEYCLFIIAAGLECEAMPRKEAAGLLRQLLGAASQAGEPEEDTNLASVHRKLHEKYGELPYQKTDHAKAAEVTLALLRQKHRITLRQAKANMRLHGLEPSTFAIWNLRNEGKLKVVGRATYELVV